MPVAQQSFLSLGPEGFHRVAYTDWGDPGSRDVVLCVHGLSRNSRDFDDLAGELSHTCRVVCMDVVGRGDSDWLEDKSGYTFSTYLSDAAALIARVTTPPRAGLLAGLQERFLGRSPETRLHWVGTSMGGLIGMLLAAKRGSPIRRLVLNDVGAFVPWASLFRLKGYVGKQGRFESLEEADAYVRKVCAPFGKLSPAQWRHLVEHSVFQLEDGGYALRYDPGISHPANLNADPELPIGPEFLRGIDLWATWSAVTCPVLVLRGADSDVLPAEIVAEMKRRKPDTETAEFAEVGHAPALRDPEQIAAIREFLLRAEPRSAHLTQPEETP